jgi:uncharacterized membrane protein YGL010W
MSTNWSNVHLLFKSSTSFAGDIIYKYVSHGPYEARKLATISGVNLSRLIYVPSMAVTDFLENVAARLQDD